MNKIRLLSEVSCINVNSNILKLLLKINRSLKLKRNENNAVLPAGRKLNSQFEYSDDHHRAKKIERRKGEIVNRKLNSALWSQNLINQFKNNICTFISRTNFTPYANKCISLTQISALNRNCVRYYSTQTKKKNLNDDLLTCKKQEGCNFNKGTGKQETVPCPAPQETSKIPDSKDICSEIICKEGTNQEVCQKREIKKDNSQKKVPKPITTLTPINAKEKETQVKLNDEQKEKKLQHKTKCKICKPEPQFKLHRFRPPPTWKVWLYSFLGLTLRTSKIGIDLLKCCKITSQETVTWVKLKEYPKPVLEPSKNHLSREPGKRKLIRPNEVKADNKKEMCKKEPSTINLQKDNNTNTTAKWAVKGSDTKVTVTGDKTTDLGKKIDKKIEIEKPSTDVISSSVNNIQVTTSDFCRTLIDLCGSKTTSSCNERKKHGAPKKSNDNKEQKKNDKQSAHPVPCDKTKHACDKKIDTKNMIKQMPYKKNSNSLETTEEFLKKKYETPEMPKHYTGGAGEIERKLLEKQKASPHKVEFRYRDICKRKPEERIRGVNN